MRGSSRLTSALEQRELRRVFAQVGAEGNLGDLLTEKPVTAEDDADLAWSPRSLGDEPGRGAPLLAVVPADIGRCGLGPEFGQNGEGRHAARAQGRDRVADARVIDRDDGDRVRALAEPEQALGDDGGRKVRREIDDRFAAKPRERTGRCGEVGAELRIERVLPLQQKGKRALRQVGARAIPQQRCGMIADPVGRPDDALGGRLAHAVAGVEHPVDGGDADAGGPREIGDGGAAAHGSAPQGLRQNATAVPRDDDGL